MEHGEVLLSADVIFEQLQSKKRIKYWRNIAFGLIGVIVLLLFSRANDTVGVGGDYIARVVFEGLILEDTDRIAALKRLKEDDHVKAVIVSVNSPGGTIVGGESLYKAIKDIREKKPVVATMGGMATSGGYMTAMAAQHIVAYEGTITGSIGVLVQTAEITDLASKLGVKLETFKSDELKGTPSPLEKMTPKVREYMQDNLKQAHQFFMRLVSEARAMPMKKVEKIADGRIFMGNEAVSLGLVDAIGDEEDARVWLNTNYEISLDTPVRFYKLKKEINGISKFISVLTSKQHYVGQFLSGGMMTLWEPGLTNGIHSK